MRDRRGSTSVWDHDLWEMIYELPDKSTKDVAAHLYRLILDMRNNDVLAQKIASAVNVRNQRHWKLWHKALIATGAIVMLIGNIISIAHGVH